MCSGHPGGLLILAGELGHHAAASTGGSLAPHLPRLWGAASLGCLAGTEQLWSEGCPASCPFQPVAKAQAPVGFLPSRPFHFHCGIPQLSACRPTAGPAWPTFALWAFSHMLMRDVQDLGCSWQTVRGESVSIPSSRRWLSERVLLLGQPPSGSQPGGNPRTPGYLWAPVYRDRVTVTEAGCSPL